MFRRKKRKDEINSCLNLIGNAKAVTFYLEPYSKTGIMICLKDDKEVSWLNMISGRLNSMREAMSWCDAHGIIYQTLKRKQVKYMQEFCYGIMLAKRKSSYADAE